LKDPVYRGIVCSCRFGYIRVLGRTMLRPRAWLDSLRVQSGLRDYPVYSPPYSGVGPELSRSEGEANYSYFLEQKDARLKQLGEFLAQFDVLMTIDERGIRNVSAWLHRFAGHLIVNSLVRTSKAYFSFDPQWKYAHRGLNVVWDVGIFAGEAIINLNQQCGWELDTGEIFHATRHTRGYLRPCIAGTRPPGCFDVFEFCLAVTRAKQKLVTVGATTAGIAGVAADAFEKGLRFWASPDPRQSARVY